MKSEQKTDGTLVLRYDSAGWSRFGFGLAIVLSILLAYELVTGQRFGDGLGGVIGGIAMALVMGIAMFETSHVEVDPVTREVRYRRRWAWKHYAGTLPFDSIEHVIAETPIGDSGIPSRRIVLEVRDRPAVPLVAGYSPDVGDETRKLADRIRAMIRQPPR